MKKSIVKSLLIGLGAATATAVFAATPPIDIAAARTIDVAVFGDSPYGTSPTDVSQVLATPAFITSINRDTDVSLVLHVGDIHSGKQYCTEAYDQEVYDLWTVFQDPLVYIPGDNEWADCHKKGEGGGVYNPNTGQIDYVLDGGNNPIDYANGDPIANLNLIRSIFFPYPGFTLGGERKALLSQARLSDPNHPADRNYVENVIWKQANVLFVAVNIPGGSNNGGDIWYGTPALSGAQANEIAERTGAGIRWLDKAFTRAKAERVDAMVIITQADMWDLDGKPAAHLAGYEPILFDIAMNTRAFNKPVLLFNGDSHTYRSDNPLQQGAACVKESGAAVVPCADDDWNQHPSYEVPNFHRVVVHGSTFPFEWLKLTIDPRVNAPASADAFGPFSWVRMIP